MLLLNACPHHIVESMRGKEKFKDDEPTSYLSKSSNLESLSDLNIDSLNKIPQNSTQNNIQNQNQQNYIELNKNLKILQDSLEYFEKMMEIFQDSLNLNNISNLNNPISNQKDTSIYNLKKFDNKQFATILEKSKDKSKFDKQTILKLKDSIQKTIAKLNDSLLQEKNNSQLDSNTQNSTSNKEKSAYNLEIQSVDIQKYPEISIKALVRNEKGNYITGLAKPYLDSKFSNLKLWQDITDSSCKTSTIKDFDVEEIRSSSGVKHSIVYLLDHSGSMGQSNAQDLQVAIKKMIYNTRDSDYVSVIKFTTNSKIEVPLTNDLRKAYFGVKTDGLKSYSGGTAIPQALDSAFKQHLDSPNDCEKIIVLLSDGIDGTTELTMNRIISKAKRMNIKVYTVFFGMTFGDAKFLRTLSESTGGRYYRVFSSKEFPYLFADIYMRLNNFYRITYKSPICASKHKVDLSLKLPISNSNILLDSFYFDKSEAKVFAQKGEIRVAYIRFESGKAEIMSDSHSYLDSLAKDLANNPKVSLEISGHTDNVGSKEENKILSQKRAEAVKIYLSKKGIEPKRLTCIGMGEEFPLVPNNSNENKAKNRRTEFTVIDN